MFAEYLAIAEDYASRAGIVTAVGVTPDGTFVFLASSYAVRCPPMGVQVAVVCHPPIPIDRASVIDYVEAHMN